MIYYVKYSKTCKKLKINEQVNLKKMMFFFEKMMFFFEKMKKIII